MKLEPSVLSGDIYSLPIEKGIDSEKILSEDAP
jgi:hypothetical protein